MEHHMDFISWVGVAMGAGAWVMFVSMIIA